MYLFCYFTILWLVTYLFYIKCHMEWCNVSGVFSHSFKSTAYFSSVSLLTIRDSFPVCGDVKGTGGGQSMTSSVLCLYFSKFLDAVRNSWLSYVNGLFQGILKCSFWGSVIAFSFGSYVCNSCIFFLQSFGGMIYLL